MRPDRLAPATCLVALVWGASALAGGRAHYGGALKVATVSRGLASEPISSDSPVEAATAMLRATPACRWGTWSRPTPGLLRLTLSPGLSAIPVAEALERVRQSTSPYRALLFPIKSLSASATAIELVLRDAAPGLERVLCHPALGVVGGPFRAPALTANPAWPEGRPYLDAVVLAPSDARSAERALLQRRVDAIIGHGPDVSGAQLFATWLLVHPALSQHVRRAVESSVDRADLARFFLRPPASPLWGLLPAALGGPSQLLLRPAKPPAVTPPRDVALHYDAGLDDQRTVAERLQVKLQPFGYRVALQPHPRAELWQRWARGDFELLLATALLPPDASAALDLTLEVARSGSGSSPEGPSVPDAAAQLLPRLHLIPLAVQGLALATSPRLLHLSRDEYGLPRIDDAFLSPE
jgi:hypothetical protein